AGALFRSAQSRVLVEVCLRAQPPLARAAMAQRERWLPLENRERRYRQTWTHHAARSSKLTPADCASLRCVQPGSPSSTAFALDGMEERTTSARRRMPRNSTA